MLRNLTALARTTRCSRSDAGGAFAGLLAESEAAGSSVFLLGASPAVIYDLRDRLAASSPGLRLSGICDGDFAGPVSAEIVSHIRRAKPDVVVVDFSPRRFDEFRRDHAGSFAGVTLVNLPGAFEALLETSREHGEERARGRAGRLTLQLGAASRFPRILLRQFARERLRALGVLRGAATATQQNR